MWCGGGENAERERYGKREGWRDFRSIDKQNYRGRDGEKKSIGEKWRGDREGRERERERGAERTVQIYNFLTAVVGAFVFQV